MITGLRQKTYDNLQLNAGVLLYNFDYASYTSADALETAILALLEADSHVFGATRGGGTFDCTPTMREIEADGKRGPWVGSSVLDEMPVKMTGTLIEVTPENAKMLLMCADKTVSGKVSTVKARTSIKKTDYLTNIVWVGDTAEGYCLIALKNPLNTAGFKLTFTDKGEGTMAFEFSGHAASLSDTEYAPFEILFFDGSTVASAINVYSVEGSASGKTLITVTPQKTAAQSYKYKTSATANIPAADEVLTTGWTDWDGSAEITATDGNLIVVAIVTTADNKCVSAGRTTVVSAT